MVLACTDMATSRTSASHLTDMNRFPLQPCTPCSPQVIYLNDPATSPIVVPPLPAELVRCTGMERKHTPLN